MKAMDMMEKIELEGIRQQTRAVLEEFHYTAVSRK